MNEKPKKIECERDAMCNVGTLGTRRTILAYATEKHDLHAVLKPDYFRNVVPDFGMRHGDVMDCIIGDPVEGLHLRLVIDWKQRLEPICVAIVWKHKATPCRHDGGVVEEAA